MNDPQSHPPTSPIEKQFRPDKHGLNESSNTNSLTDPVDDQVFESRFTKYPSNQGDRWLFGLSERVSPILIKESRQALKSKHFLLTFIFVSIAALVWTIIGIISTGAVTDYERALTLFRGYAFILSLPLVAIIPLVAFRSIVSERDEATMDLLSITTLKPSQIVFGKLASNLSLSLVYLSVLTPCVVFCYFLGGIQLLEILIVVGLTVAFSLFLTVAGLFLGSLSLSSNMRLIVFIGSAIACFLAWWTLAGLIFESTEYLISSWQNQENFVALTIVMLANFAAFALVLYSATIGQITFLTDNRTTKVRLALLLQQLLFIALVATIIFAYRPTPVSAGVQVTLVATIFWSAIGALIYTEPKKISSRVQRSIPQSYAGRLFFSWLMPGAGRGFVFAVCNMLAFALVISLIMHFVDHQPIRRAFFGAGYDWGQEFLAPLIVAFYGILYLSLFCLFFDIFRTKVQSVPSLVALLEIAAIFLSVWMLPSLTRSWGIKYEQNAILNCPSIFWASERMSRQDNATEFFVFFYCMIAAAALATVVVFVNRKQFGVHYQAAPDRVLEDDEPDGSQPSLPVDPLA